MSERINPTERSPQSLDGLERTAGERLRRRAEAAPEQASVERARQQNVEQARERLAKTETPAPTERATVAEPSQPRPVLTKAANYRQTMVSLRHRLSPASRSFSRLIHTPVVEKTSQVVGSTVLRPSVSLGATTTAVLLTGFIYFYARHFGFELRGSEIWLSLLIGGAIGLAIEGLWKLLVRLASRN